MHTIVTIALLSLATPSINQTNGLAPNELIDSIHREAQAISHRNPEILKAVHSAQGIRPSHYQKRRLPRPEVARELKRIPKAAPVLMSLYISKFSSVPFSSHGDSEAERNAMRNGVLSAVGSSGHPLADRFLTYVAESESRQSLPADVLFRALGQTQTPHALTYLVNKANDKTQPLPLRASAIHGIGHHRTPGAARALIAYFHHSLSILQSAAISASAILGSSWAWKALGKELEGVQIRNKLAGEILEAIQKTKSISTAALMARAQEVLATIGTQETLNQLEWLSKNTTPGNHVFKFAKAALERVRLGLSRR